MRCSGIPGSGLKFFNVSDGPRLAAWILTELGDAKWRTESQSISRKRKGNGVKAPVLAISVLRDAESVEFNTLNGREIIVARLHAQSAGATDFLFGTTAGPLYEKYFYLVFDGWKGDESATAQDTTIGKWSIYGIRKASAGSAATVVPVGKRGTFRWCKDPDHTATEKDGSRFMTCDYVTFLSRIQSSEPWRSVLALYGGSLMLAVENQLKTKRDSASVRMAVAALLGARNSRLSITQYNAAHQVAVDAVMRAFADDEFSPAWMLCGGGCCTADF